MERPLVAATTDKMTHNPERNEAVAAAMSDIRTIDSAGITRESVEQYGIGLSNLRADGISFVGTTSLLKNQEMGAPSI